MKLYKFNIGDNPYEVKINSIQGVLAYVEVNGIEYEVDITGSGLETTPQPQGVQMPISTPTIQPQPSLPVQARQTGGQTAPPKSSAGANDITSPMPGIVHKINVSVGDTVKPNDTLIIIEAMKMENKINATKNGTIETIHVKEGDSILEGALLFSLASSLGG